MTRGEKQATEFLWCNFPPPIALHDYRFLGVTWRERERNKRKKQRWTARFHNMRPHERHALLAAIGGAWRIPSPETAPVASPVLTMPRLEADIAACGEAELAS